MSRTKRVLLVGHDRGGVNLLVPLLAYWQDASLGIEAEFLSTPMIQYEVMSMTRAVKSDRLQAKKVSGTNESYIGRSVWTFSDDQLTDVLKSKPWDLVLTGTSLLSNMEKSVWRLCRERAIPCAAICDMWTEYQRRLTDEAGEAPLDTLLVLDERMRDEAETALGGRIKTRVVGSPHFAQLISNRVRPLDSRTKIRFISEPIAALFPQAGIHEFHIAEMLIEALDEIGMTSALVLRPHPQDDSEAWRRFVYDHRHKNVYLDDEPSWACPLTTKVAIGLSSMMLIELAMAGVPAASLQLPGSDSSYFCLHEAEQGIAVLRDQAALMKWLIDPPAPQVSPAFIAQHKSAIQTITESILADTLLA